MAEEITAPVTTVGEMQVRREKMADGHRYIIYYTFGSEASSPDKTDDTHGEVNADV